MLRAGGSSLALVPCCHSLDAKWLRVGEEERRRIAVEAQRGSVSQAIDAHRCRLLRESEYAVEQVAIPAEITPHNNLILAWRQGGAEHTAAGQMQMAGQTAPRQTAVSATTHQLRRGKALDDGRRALAGRFPVQRNVAQRPAYIPVADAEAMAALARGKRRWRRDLELSVWCAEDAPLTPTALELLGRYAAAPAWDVVAAVAAAAGGVSPEDMSGCDSDTHGACGSCTDACGALCGVEESKVLSRADDGIELRRAWLREVYCNDAGRRSCSFRVEFEAGREIGREEGARLQARLRDAVARWGAASGGAFELR